MKSSDEAKPGLRRSSRSTRGSVKPRVDLTKEPDVVSTEDQPADDLSEKSEEVEQVLVLSSNDEKDDDDEDFKISTAKPKRTSRVTSNKQSVKKTDEESTKQQSKTKTTRGGPRKSTASTTATKKTTKAGKKEKEEQQEKEEHDSKLDEDDADAYCYELSSKEMKEINNAFDLNCSEENDETLTSDDLKTAIRSLGFEPRAEEISKLLKKFANKGGRINRNNFHKIMAFKYGSTPGSNDKCVNDEISKVFNLLDLDKTGMITIDNLRSIAKELNEDINDEELTEMIVEADLDGDFQINKQEFYNIMKKTSLY